MVTPGYFTSQQGVRVWPFREIGCGRFPGAGDDKQLRFLVIWIEAVLLNPVGD